MAAKNEDDIFSIYDIYKEVKNEMRDKVGKGSTLF